MKIHSLHNFSALFIVEVSCLKKKEKQKKLLVSFIWLKQNKQQK